MFPPGIIKHLWCRLDLIIRVIPHISTLSTRMPQGDVPSSRSCWMPLEMLSLSLRISWRFLVPRMFLSVVWASIRVLW